MQLPNVTRPEFIHKVLLTFDDGPIPVFTSRILDELARIEARAVFFVEGHKLAAPGMKTVLERAAGDGHVIGNHGYSHSDVTRLTDEQIRSEIRLTEDLIGDLDRGIKLFRPPFTQHNDRVDRLIAELGYTLLLWNVDSQDWNAAYQPALWVDHTAGKIRRRQANGRRRSVCVFHDLAATAQHLPRLLTTLDGLPHTGIGRYDSFHGDVHRICPPDAIAFPLDDVLVVARTETISLCILNETASVLWERLAGGVSKEETARQLANAYAIPVAAAAKDVDAALAAWRLQGICGPARPECEDPGAWPIDYGEAPDRAGIDFQCTHTYHFLDLDFRIRFESPGLAAAMHPRLANLETALEDDSSAHQFEVCVAGEVCVLRELGSVVACHPSPAALAYHLFFRIVRLARPQLDPMAWLHAACVGNASATIALVGNNGSGKSTLCAALAQCGFQTFSDDRVFLDSATLRLAAVPNSISLKRGSWPALLSRYAEIERLPIVHSDGEELRFLNPPPPADRLLKRVTHVFFPRYQAAVSPASAPLTATQGLSRIAAAKSWISSEPRHLERFLRWARQVHFFDLAYPDLNSAIALIQDRLSQ